MNTPRYGRRALQCSMTLVAALTVSNCAVQPSLPPRPAGYEMPSQAEMQEQFMRQRGRTQRVQAPTSGDGIELVIPKGHSGALTAVTLSPDGRFILSLSRDDTAKLWDVASGREVRTFVGFEYLMAGGQAGFTSDGKRLIIADLQSARVYEIESGRELYRFGSLNHPPLVSPDGRYAVSAESETRQGTSTLIEVATRKPLWVLPKDGTQRPFLLSADGRVLLTMKHKAIDPRQIFKGMMDLTRTMLDAELQVWDVPARKLRGSMPVAADNVAAKALSGDGSLLALETSDRRISVIDLQTRKEVIALNSDRKMGAISTATLAFSPDGRLLAWGAYDGQARVWELPSGRVVAQLQASALNFSANGETLVLGGASGGAPWLHDIASGKETRLAGASSGVGDITILARGQRALAGMYDGTAKLWDLTSGEVLRTYGCLHSPMVSSVAVSADERVAALGCMDRSAVLWDLATGRQLREITAPKKPGQMLQYSYTHVRFTPDGRTLIVAAADEVALWDLASGKNLRRFVVPAEAPNSPLAFIQQANRAQMGAERAQMMAEGASHIRALAVRPDGKLIAVSNTAGVTLWDPDSGQMVSALGSRRQRGGAMAAIAEAMRQQQPGAQRGSASAPAAPDLNALMSSLGADRSRRGDQVTAGQAQVADPDELLGGLVPLSARSLAFSADGAVLSTGGRLWDVSTGEEIARRTRAPGERSPRFLDDIAETSVNSAGAAFSPDGRRLARGIGLVVRVIDVSSGKEEMELVGHTSNVESVAFSPDGRKLLSGAEDGALKLWDVTTGKELVSLIALGQNDFAAVTPDQYYRISRAGAKGVGFRVRGTVYPFEQFDLRFNRPDIVLQRLGAASPATVQSYRQAYERRLKKLGITEQMLSTEFHVPEIEILTRDIPVSVNQATLSLRVRANDSRYTLDRLNVYVNDVPVYGTRGLALRESKLRSHERDIGVPLVAGRNKIQVSVLNEQGTESLRQTVYTTSLAQFPPAEVYVLAIGVSEYRDKAYNLRFAAKDADDLIAAYKGAQAHSAGWGAVHALKLSDRNATRGEILKAKDWLKQAKVNDLVVVFAAGHGMTDDKSNYYFGTHDIDARNPAAAGLPYDEFEFLLDGVPSMQKVLLLDTCFSGEIDKDEPATTAAAPIASTRAGQVKMRSFKSPKSARGIAVAADDASEAAGSAVSASMVRFQQDWFADLRRGTGAAVISSSSGNEYSLEGEQWRNGVFTYVLLQGLKNGMADANKDRVITVSELQAYVIEQVRALTRGGQNPTVRHENLEYDFAVY
jgi:WD40 repeat protein